MTLILDKKSVRIIDEINHLFVLMKEEIRFDSFCSYSLQLKKSKHQDIKKHLFCLINCIKRVNDEHSKSKEYHAIKNIC